MSNHPSRNWKRRLARWALDENSMEARHESGLIVRFVPHNLGGWDVHSPNGAEILAAWAADGDDLAADRVQRLTDEAAQLFERALAQRERQD